MAFCDYHACDNCGERKTFYDASMNVELVDGVWRYDYANGGDSYPAFPGYRLWALCNECEKTHEIVIRPIDKATMPESAVPTGICPQETGK